MTSAAKRRRPRTRPSASTGENRHVSLTSTGRARHFHCPKISRSAPAAPLVLSWPINLLPSEQNLAGLAPIDIIGKSADDWDVKYPGGKGKCFQHIINVFPPHTTYIETHLGGGAVLRNKRAARRSIGIDKDKQVISFWRNNYPDLAEYVHADAVEFLRSYPFKGSELIYCDPPYLPSTRKRSRVYRHDLTEADHGVLLDALVQLPCLVAISGYTSALYRSRLQGWQSIQFSAKAHDSVREEWLWANYGIPEELHDMQHFGANYRERQNFKRRMERLRRRIERLTKPEQHELVRLLSIQLRRGEMTNAAVYLPQGR
jgi:DNA adenine methylase